MPALPFLADATSLSSTTFEWGNPMPAWLVFTFVVVIGAVVILSYRRESGGAGGFTRGFLGFLRLLIVLTIFALICEPQLVKEDYTFERSTVAVMLDISRSQSLTDRYAGVEWTDELLRFLNEERAERTVEGEGGAPVPLTAAELQRLPRFEIARVAARAFGDELEEAGNHNLVWYAFDSAVSRDVLPESLQPEGTETRIGSAIDDVVTDLSGKVVSGIVVFTDGQSNGGKLTPEDVADSLAPSEGIPVFMVGVGDPTPPRDVWISDLHAPERALVDDTVVFDFVVGNYGFQGETVRAELQIRRQDGGLDREVDYAAVELGEPSERIKEQLRYRFTDPGDYLCTVTVRGGQSDSEIDLENNTATHLIKIIDRRIKVLYVEGYPRWEYRALVPAMIRDRSVEAYCLLQSADLDFVQEVSPGFEPLEAFPPAPAEGEPDPLFDFDVILIGDVDLGRDDFGLDVQARERLVTFVENVGGGVVFLSGGSHNPIEFESDASLRKLLPIVVEPGRDLPFVNANDPFRLELTREGRVNPILRFRDDPAENRLFIEGGGNRQLPSFYWYYPVDVVKPAAQVLATHESDRTQLGRKRPILVTQQLGRGKIFWSATDDIWRWRRSIGDKYYYRFWGQVIRAMSQGKLLGSSNRISLYTSRPEYSYGEQVEISAEVLRRDYKPVSLQELPELEVMVQSLDDPSELERLILLPKASPTGYIKEGLYTGVAIPRGTGRYRVTLGHVPDLEAGEGTPPEANFIVQEPAIEMANPFMDEERLRAIATRTGSALAQGEFVLPHQVTGLASRMPRETLKIPNDSVPPMRLWHPNHANWLILLLLAYGGIITVEWIGRKLARML